MTIFSGRFDGSIFRPRSFRIVRTGIHYPKGDALKIYTTYVVGIRHTKFLLLAAPMLGDTGYGVLRTRYLSVDGFP
jgi:hypothetical protein